MKKYYYDLHIHSCLSPCADNDNTPYNIVGMAKLCGLDVIALTDHNSCKNCPPFFKAAEKYGVIPIAGMELTTSEDIHVVCLFEKLSDALGFDDYVCANRKKIKNKPDIFGNQIVTDNEDNPSYEEEYLLINATNISISDVKRLIEGFNGICYPAHIDRDANGIIGILGAIPEGICFDYFETSDATRIEELSSLHGIPHDRFIVDSDSHLLTDLRDGEHYFEIDDKYTSQDEIRRAIFDILRRSIK